MNSLALPLLFASGFVLGVYAVSLLRWLLALPRRVRLDHAVPRDPGGTTPPLVEFDIRMSNEEWVDAVIAETLRKIGGGDA
jgi:hypothetical protein